MSAGMIILNGFLIIIVSLSLTVVTLEKINTLRTTKTLTLAWYGFNIIYFIILWVVFVR